MSVSGVLNDTTKPRQEPLNLDPGDGPDHTFVTTLVPTLLKSLGCFVGVYPRTLLRWFVSFWPAEENRDDQDLAEAWEQLGDCD